MQKPLLNTQHHGFEVHVQCSDRRVFHDHRPGCHSKSQRVGEIGLHLIDEEFVESIGSFFVIYSEVVRCVPLVPQVRYSYSIMLQLFGN